MEARQLLSGGPLQITFTEVQTNQSVTIIDNGSGDNNPAVGTISYSTGFSSPFRDFAINNYQAISNRTTATTLAFLEQSGNIARTTSDGNSYTMLITAEDDGYLFPATDTQLSNSSSVTFTNATPGSSTAGFQSSYTSGANTTTTTQVMLASTGANPNTQSGSSTTSISNGIAPFNLTDVYTIGLESGASVSFRDTGLTTVPGTNASLAGNVYVDVTDSGARVAGDPPIGGVTITLSGTDALGNPVNKTTTTAANGTYIFSNLTTGVYTVTETPVTGFGQGSTTPGIPTDGTPTSPGVSPASTSNITISGGQHLVDYDFGELQDDLAITKTDGSATYTPGNPITYTITVTNNGPSVALGAMVTDTIPANITGVTWTSSTTGTASVSSGATGSGNNLSATVNVAAGAGNSVVFTVSGTVLSSATGNLTNTATVATTPGIPDSNPNNNTSTDTDTPSLVDDLAIFKTDGSTTYTPGNPITYTITVTNNGPSDAIGASVADTLPATITGVTWTSSTSGSAAVTAGASGSGNSLTATVNVAAGVGNSVVFTVHGTVLSSATGNLTNTATVTTPPGTTDSNPNNNSSTDTDTPTASYDLGVTKDDGVLIVSPGETTTYTIVVSNSASSPSNATNVSVVDPLPSGVTSFNWTATGTSGASGFNTSGSGSINETIGSLAPGASVTYKVNALISNPVPSGQTAITNTVTISPDSPTIPNDPTPNTATDIDGLPVNCPSCNQNYYPYTGSGSTQLTAVAFNESAVLRAASTDLTDGVFKLYYNDEHALALGVRQVSTLVLGTFAKTSTSVTVNTTTGLFPGIGETVSGTGIASGTTIVGVGPGNTISLSTPTTAAGTNATLTCVANYTVSPLPSDPGSVTNPMVGGSYKTPSQLGLNPATVSPAQLAAAEPQGNTDASGRPLFPSLYLTDITNVANPFTFKGNTTSGSKVISSISSMSGLTTGDPITGTGIPAGTIISTLGPGSQITLSNAATANGTGVTLTDTPVDNAANHIGDWQYGGAPISPNAVFGTWKAFTESINRTTSTPTMSLTADSDPTANNWNLGPGADTPPPGLLNEGYGAEATWNLNQLASTINPATSQPYLIPGHAYRFYVIDHDGDQNKSGGDSGQACFDFFYPGPVQNPSTLSGTVYNDTNNNGVKDSGEAGIANVAVELLDKLGNVQTTVYTDANGNYSFKNLAANTTYRIVEVQPSGFNDGKDKQDPAGSSTGITKITVTNDIYAITVGGAGNAVGTGYNFGEIGPLAPSATRTVSGTFNSTAIASGNTIWFSSVVKMNGLSSTGTTDVHVRLANSSITLTPKTGPAITIPVPNALSTFSSSTTDATATTTFDSTNNIWLTTEGKTTTGNYFLSAFPWVVPAGVTLAQATMSWTGTFLDDSSAANVSSFQAAAAVYNTTTGSPVIAFPSDFNQIKVKPTDNSTAPSPYNNTDPAGTPEGTVSAV
jgi:uncharacterized repeat protein (TIGR01451 family)